MRADAAVEPGLELPGCVLAGVAPEGRERRALVAKS